MNIEIHDDSLIVQITGIQQVAGGTFNEIVSKLVESGIINYLEYGSFNTKGLG